MGNLTVGQVMFDGKEKLQRVRPAHVIATPVEDCSQAATTAGETIILVMNDEDKVTPKVAPGEEIAEKGHTVYSRLCPSEEDMRASVRAARKTKNARMIATKADSVDAMTNVKEVFRVVDPCPKAG